MAGTNYFPKIQKQLAQLEICFNAPLFKDMQVDHVTDLLTFQWNYNHKLVWVIEHACYYYLSSGDGSNALDWTKSVSKASISLYNPNQSYLQSEVVFISGKIYSAKSTVGQYLSPLDNPDLWLCISGEGNTVRYIFNQITSFILYTEIANPIFEVCLGTVKLDPNLDPVIDPATGLVEFEDLERVDAPVIRRFDLPANNGLAYELAFYQDGVISTELFTGCINIK